MWPNPDPVDQRLAARLEAIARQVLARRAEFARQGAVVATWRWRGGRRLGPYYRLAYREHGRQRSIYLGRSEGLAEKVRWLLADVQAPLRRHRAWLRTRARLAAQLRRQKARWREALRSWGLYTKGCAVRGWRRRPLRSARRLGSPVNGAGVGIGWRGVASRDPASTPGLEPPAAERAVQRP